MMVVNDIISKALMNKGVYYYIMPTYRQVKQVIWDDLLDKHLPKEVYSKKNESELTIHFVNGSILRFVGSEDIDKHRGINPIYTVFDECQEIKEEMWTTIIQPVIRENKGRVSFIGTPKGKNWFYYLLQSAKTNPKWYWDVKSVYDTKGISEDELEEAKTTTLQHIFNQEYLCEFQDDGSGVFRRVRNNIFGDLSLFPDPRKKYIMGVDLARHVDWTVLIVVDRHTHQVVHFDRFNQIDWALQKARIEATARRWNMCPIRIDSTGIGDPICEDLERMGLIIEPYKFTNESKKALIENLALLIEQDKIKYPEISELVSELEAFTYEKLPSGRLRYTAPDGQHDDIVMSMALAYYDIGVKIPLAPEWEMNYNNSAQSFDKYEVF